MTWLCNPPVPRASSFDGGADLPPCQREEWRDCRAAANRHSPAAHRQTGFTLLGILFLVAGLGAAMAALGTVWHTAVKREKERELLFVGDQYRRAIESFWQASPKGQERLPKNFDELLKDPRFPDTRRHLRRAYRDPITGQVAWGLVKAPDGGIAGVYSLSEAESMKVANFPPGYESFETVPSYRQWVFQFSVQGTSSEGGAGTGQGGTQGAANNAGGTADTQQPSTQKVPYDPMAWLDKVYQCEMVKQAAYQACLPYHSSGNQTAWKSCTAEVSSNYAACING